MALTFKGGTHVREYKNTRGVAIEAMPAPPTVSIAMSQHIGLHCKPVVAVGDHVYYGQVIGRVEGGLGCPVHASVSGTVQKIENRYNAMGVPVAHVVIENDEQYTPDPAIKPWPKPLEETTPDEIVGLLQEAGIAGMGGATFPTHAKLRSAIGRVDTMIINCAECEPFITANHRVMLERPDEIIGGARVLLHALGLKEAIIGVENNKMDAVEVLRQHATGNDIRVEVLKTKYPQGDERQLIFAVTGRELPPGKLPADLGCIIFNAETTAAVWHAFYRGMPLVRRVVTVDGDCVAHPKNLLVNLGTSYRDLINYCGGLVKDPAKIVNGGPMMGFAQWDMDGPVTKGTSAILVLSQKFCDYGKSGQPATCLRCGRCVKNCPMHLMPNMLVQLSMHRRYSDAAAYNVMSCVECGTCSYNCPGQMPIVQYIRVAKGAIRAEQAAARARAVEHGLDKKTEGSDKS